MAYLYGVGLSGRALTTAQNKRFHSKRVNGFHILSAEELQTPLLLLMQIN
jgi:hypothetical protein